jgi:hypothetical protein
MFFKAVTVLNGHFPCFEPCVLEGWQQYPNKYVSFLGSNSPEWAFSLLGVVFAGGLATVSPQICLFLGSNSPEWAFSLLGAVFAGGLATGVYTTNTAEAVLYQLKHRSADLELIFVHGTNRPCTRSNRLLFYSNKLKIFSLIPMVQNVHFKVCTHMIKYKFKCMYTVPGYSI